MPRARALTVPRSARPDQTTLLNRQLRRWLGHECDRLRRDLDRSARGCAADRYRKHFGHFGHACLLLFHGLGGGSSLRQSYAAFADCPGLLARSGLAAAPAEPAAAGLTVSYRQVAASNTSRPAAFLAGLVPGLAARVRQQGRSPAGGLPVDLHALDSTFVRLSLGVASWLPSRGGADAPGVRVQVRYGPALDLPEHVVVTDTRRNDCQGFDQAVLDDPAQLAALRDQTLAIDLGYYSHARLARLRAAGVHFVCPRQAQATVVVEAERPIQPALPGLGGGRVAVLADQRVTVGSASNRRGAVLRGLRLVTAEVAPRGRSARRTTTPTRYEVLTDRWDLGAAEVVQLYLWRWEIELFFRWLKQHLHLPRWLGYSRNAVELTVWLAIVVHLLTVLAARALGWSRRSPTLRERLRWALAHLDPAPAAGAPRQLALPGWGLEPAHPT